MAGYWPRRSSLARLRVELERHLAWEVAQGQEVSIKHVVVLHEGIKVAGSIKESVSLGVCEGRDR